METQIALVQTKTFWVALLGLLTQVAAAEHWSVLYGFATDAHSVDLIMQIVSGLLFVGAMWTRKAATAKVLTLLPSRGGSTLNASVWATAVALALALALGGCSKEQAQQDAQILKDQAQIINGTLNDPDVQSAIAGLQKLNQGVVCVLSAGATLTANVASAFKATRTVNGATMGAVATRAICEALGGTVPASK